ncbi:NADH-quinone oxidoreductase subunit NuoN, partial [Streptosporangium sandarakinum]
MNGTIQAPTIEYALLSPMLIVFGAAIIGVLIEAFAPRYLRKSIHMPLTLLALLGAFATTILGGVNGLPTSASAMGAVAVDGPALFVWGIILILAFVSVLLINDDEQFVAQAAAVPGSSDEEEAVRSGYAQTEVYPLLLFAVGGMLLFSSANDLLAMFVGLEV